MSGRMGKTRLIRVDINFYKILKKQSLESGVPIAKLTKKLAEKLKKGVEVETKWDFKI